MNAVCFETVVEHSTSRLDTYVAHEFELFTRSQFKQRVLSTTVNGKSAKPSTRIKPGDTIHIEYLPERESLLVPEEIPLDILYEDKNVLVVNKVRGMVVHPGAGNSSATLVNAFLFHCSLAVNAELLSEGTSCFRPGIVHRLDKDTTGVIILAKNSSSLHFLSQQFRERNTVKYYIAVVKGTVNCSGQIHGFIRRSRHNPVTFVYDESQGKEAHTLYHPLSQSESPHPASLLRLRPITGRTHQLRVHTKYLGHPVLGDPLYNPTTSSMPLMLHAQSLSIHLPGMTRPTTFSADLPSDMKQVCADFQLKLPNLLSDF